MTELTKAQEERAIVLTDYMASIGFFMEAHPNIQRETIRRLKLELVEYFDLSETKADEISVFLSSLVFDPLEVLEEELREEAAHREALIPSTIQLQSE